MIIFLTWCIGLTHASNNDLFSYRQNPSVELFKRNMFPAFFIPCFLVGKSCVFFDFLGQQPAIAWKVALPMVTGGCISFRALEHGHRSMHHRSLVVLSWLIFPVNIWLPHNTSIAERGVNPKHRNPSATSPDHFGQEGKPAGVCGHGLQSNISRINAI